MRCQPVGKGLRPWLRVILISSRFLVDNPEILLIVIFVPVFIFGSLAFGLCLPELGQVSFVLNHYVVPVIIGFLLSLLVVGLQSWKVGLMVGLLCVFSILAHFNFKAWIPLVNPRLYDDSLYRLDVLLRVPDFTGRISMFLDELTGFDVDFLYHGLFVFLFFLCFLLVGLRGGLLDVRRLNYSMCFVLLLGGVLYWVLPALGPFVYADGSGVQLYMKHLNEQIRVSGSIPVGFFIQGMAAMPSLHLAHATVFVVYARRASRCVWPVFAVSWLWFFFESMALGWHYFADIPAGVLLGLVAVFVSDQAFTRERRGVFLVSSLKSMFFLTNRKTT